MKKWQGRGGERKEKERRKKEGIVREMGKMTPSNDRLGLRPCHRQAKYLITKQF